MLLGSETLQQLSGVDCVLAHRENATASASERLLARRSPHTEIEWGPDER